MREGNATVQGQLPGGESVKSLPSRSRGSVRAFCGGKNHGPEGPRTKIEGGGEKKDHKEEKRGRAPITNRAGGQSSVQADKETQKFRRGSKRGSEKSKERK